MAKQLGDVRQVGLGTQHVRETAYRVSATDEKEKDEGRFRLPPGWDEARVQRLIEQHYESLTEEQAVAEDEEALVDDTQTMMEIPNELVAEVRELLSRHAG